MNEITRKTTAKNNIHIIRNQKVIFDKNDKIFNSVTQSLNNLINTSTEEKKVGF